MLHFSPPTLSGPPLSPPSQLLRRSRRLNSLLKFTSLFPLRASFAVLSLDAGGSQPQVSPKNDELSDDFVEVGYVSSVHGLNGQLRVKPTTDFPQLRFAQPGKRWIRSRVFGRDAVSEVDLVAGRSHPGQKTWIVSFDGIDTVEKAKQIVGSTLLVKEEDRPDLEEGEFYTPDLIGMRVLIKETGKLVGTVFSVVNYGANDLLQVRLGATEGRDDGAGLVDQEIASSQPYVWIPFVEAIVPEVDMDKREMHITPPKGLLDLNIRPDTRSKKERRQLEWKQRKQLQRRLVTAKRKLSELGQKHILDGLTKGEKTHKTLLANQIVGINLSSFQRAHQSISMHSERYSLLDVSSSSNLFKISQKCLHYCASEMKDDMIYDMQKKGSQLLKKAKSAIIVIVNHVSHHEGKFTSIDLMLENAEPMVVRFEEILLDCKQYLKGEEEGMTIPLIVVSQQNEIHLFQELFSINDYFGFNNQKVWFLEEEKLPKVSTDEKLIIMRNPWEISQSPTGPGGVFSLLCSHGIVDDLNAMGIEYVQICSLDDRSIIGHPLLFGFLSSCGAEVAISIFEEGQGEDVFNVIITMKHLNKVCKHADKLQFRAVEEPSFEVEQVDKELESKSNGTNSYRFYLPLYSFLSHTSLSKICVMQISS